MAKRYTAPKREGVCRDCIFCEPYSERFLRVADGSPVLCRCKHMPYLRLMNYDTCLNFKKPLTI